ncbi:hemin uptake protein HemP [Chromobacterium phragmitis]|uniref:hemin uptake protein HemP n=1 Tax=Chromobacterium phragmitis TaxID=2202141 RepID=UPI003D369880
MGMLSCSLSRQFGKAGRQSFAAAAAGLGHAAARQRSHYPPTAPAKPPAAASPPLLHSRQLFGGGREVLIEHQGELYRLQLTRNGKLILIK